MKRICAAIALVATAVAGSAGTNFNSATGVLVVPDVTIDGRTFFDTATLQLDLGSGTFKILGYAPKNTKISDTPLQSYENGGITIGFLGCYRSGTNQVTCYAQVTNANNDGDMAFAATNYQIGYSTNYITTRLFDNLGTPYIGTVSAFGKTSDVAVAARVLQGVPVRVSYTFTNIDSHATSIAAFSPTFLFGPTGVAFGANFKNISF